MKKAIFLLLSLVFGGQIYASAGCMATTYPRTRFFYSMAPRYVSCQCDCNGITDASGFCQDCGHKGSMARGMVEQRYRAGRTPGYFGSIDSVVETR
ncbi:hypothetical protein A3F06_04490 [candidate division TM6 bacterium RIFCSPHIGHO2_12_FULL_36_22]|nr:MAG: hypothetical protein A3F06_04490 [candidate division TM6 bacterium RIFCSPHIGHO2_12_FULL_36_22]